MNVTLSNESRVLCLVTGMIGCNMSDELSERAGCHQMSYVKGM